MAYKTHQLITKHIPECAMLNGLNGDQPWCLPEQVTDWAVRRVGRDLTGRRNPKAQHTWLLFRCSDSDCPAQLAIYWHTAERMLNLTNPAWREK
jgi:hypothetical protein